MDEYNEAREERLEALRNERRRQEAADQRDAARYRWLRDSGKFVPGPYGGWGLAIARSQANAAQLDAAVDVAMKAD